MKKSRYICADIQLSDRCVFVYAGPRILSALEEINRLDLYKGVKILDLLRAVYIQGRLYSGTERRRSSCF